METLKDKAMYLTVANSVGLFGATTYFYRQLETMKLDMVKISQTLTGIIRKLSEIEKNDQNKTEALHTLNEQIKRMNDELESVQLIDIIDNDIEELVGVLQDNNINFERTSVQNKTQNKKQNNSRRDNDERKDVRRKPIKNDKFTDKKRGDSFRDVDNYSSSRLSKDQRKPVKYEEDEDEDLIGEVRKHQGRT
jgi:TolA-binding protein